MYALAHATGKTGSKKDANGCNMLRTNYRRGTLVKAKPSKRMDGGIMVAVCCGFAG